MTHKSLDGKTSVTRVQSSAPPLAPRFLAVSAPMVTQRKHRPGAAFHHRTADTDCGRAFPPEDRARLCTLVTLFRAAMVIDVTVAAIYCHESTKFRRAGDTAALRNGRHAAGPRRSTRHAARLLTGNCGTRRGLNAACGARQGSSTQTAARRGLQCCALCAAWPIIAPWRTRPPSTLRVARDRAFQRSRRNAATPAPADS